MSWGISYVVIAVGNREEPATLEDLAVIKAAVLPFQGTILSDRVADRLTVELLHETGMF